MTLKGITSAPQRSCLGCRKSLNKDQLLRFVMTPDNEVYPDIDNRLPGRGAYTCTNNSCLGTAIKQKQFKRSFREDVTVMSPEMMEDYVKVQLLARITGLLGLANKAGKVASGSSMVMDSLKGGKKPALVIIATDVSPDIGDKVKSAAAANKVDCRYVATKEVFGDLLGKAPRSAVAVKESGFVSQLVKAIDRYRNFLGEV